MFKPCFLQNYKHSFEIPQVIRFKKQKRLKSFDNHSHDTDWLNEPHTFRNKQLLRMILERLEPIMFSPEESLYSMNKAPTKIIFPINFTVKVGFSYKNVYQRMVTNNTKRVAIHVEKPVRTIESTMEARLNSRRKGSLKTYSRISLLEKTE